MRRRCRTKTRRARRRRWCWRTATHRDDPRGRGVRLPGRLGRCTSRCEFGVSARGGHGSDRGRTRLTCLKLAWSARGDDQLEHPNGESGRLQDGDGRVLLQFLAVETGAVGRAKVEVVGAGTIEADDAMPSRNEVAFENHVVERVPADTNRRLVELVFLLASRARIAEKNLDDHGCALTTSPTIAQSWKACERSDEIVGEGRHRFSAYPPLWHVVSPPGETVGDHVEHVSLRGMRHRKR